MNLIYDIGLKITLSKLLPHAPGANELTNQSWKLSAPYVLLFFVMEHNFERMHCLEIDLFLTGFAALVVLWNDVYT